MNRFLRPISVIALLQEVAIFSGLIVTVTLTNAYEKVAWTKPRSLFAVEFLRHYWPVLALIPLIWVVLASLDEGSEDPRLSEDSHCIIGLGLLIVVGGFCILTAMTALSRFFGS